MTKLNLILIGMALLWLQPLAADVTTDRNRLIAESDVGRVVYSMVACRPAVANRHQCEQSELDRRIHIQWIDAAVKLNKVALTPDEAASAENKTKADDAHIVAAAARFKALAEGALRVRRGEDRERVLSELSKQRLTARDLDWEIEHLPTLAAAEKAAAKDYVAEGRQAARDYYAHVSYLDHLRRIVQQRAAATNSPFTAAEEQLWSDVARATHTRIVDPAFTMPARKGILVNQ